MTARHAQRAPLRTLSWPADDRGTVAEAILSPRGAGPSHGRQRLWAASAAALAVYGGIGVWAVISPPRRAPGAEPGRIEDLTVELLTLPPAPPEPVAPAPTPPPAAIPRVALARPTPKAPPPTPAAAGAALTQPAEEPLDLTSFTIASGTNKAHVGGATAGAGTSTQAVSGTPSLAGVANGAGSATLASPVRVLDDEWACPWPADADSLGIDEKDVLIRVTVRADGSTEAAELVRDPGFGFGAAALACARRTTFAAARDAAGTPIRARSGPIRVKFTR